MTDVIKVDGLKRLKIEAVANKIILGDCLSTMKKMPGESIDLVITSPPYNLKNSTGNGMKDGRGGKWETPRCKTAIWSTRTICPMTYIASGKERV